MQITGWALLCLKHVPDNVKEFGQYFIARKESLIFTTPSCELQQNLKKKIILM